MDDDLMFSNITCANQKEGEEESTLDLNKQQQNSLHNGQQNENIMQQSIYYDVNNTNYQQQQMEINEKKIEDMAQQLAVKDTKINELLDDLKQRKLEFEQQQQQQMANLNNSSVITSSSYVSDNAKDLEINSLQVEIENLKKQLDAKTTQYTELNACLVKQTGLCENLTELLRKSEEKNVDLSKKEDNNLSLIKGLETNLGKFKVFETINQKSL
jgi:hypothetical protein